MKASALILPLILAVCGICLLFGRGDRFDAFRDGAREGLSCLIGLLPALVALITALSMWNASGAAALITDWLTPICEKIGLTPDLLPFLLTRPLSGSASTASLSALFDRLGPDSAAGRIASVILGSSDTAVYVLALCFGAVGVRRTRYALPAALLVMLILWAAACRLAV